LTASGPVFSFSASLAASRKEKPAGAVNEILDKIRCALINLTIRTQRQKNLKINKKTYDIQKR